LEITLLVDGLTEWDKLSFRQKEEKLSALLILIIALWGGGGITRIFPFFVSKLYGKSNFHPKW
jgi:hypothetical protein